MGAGAVRYERRGPVAHLTFDRPEARNAMTWTMYDQLAELTDRVDADDDVRVVVLRGSGGKAFVAGTDIGQFAEFSSGADGLAYEARIEAIVGRLERVGKPTVAVVEGYAVGGGLGIAAVCDLRVCTPNARFGMPIARTLGNCLSMANYARLAALLGVARAKELIFTAGFVEAEEALAAGLVTQIIGAEELDERVAALCARLCEHAPITLRVTKEALRRIAATAVPAGDDLVEEAYGSADFAEGVAAFGDKRPPRWQSR
ncbi:MAG: enoyl-CoA hydratase/isomerase family protein [Egibacteraceae bacterium]